MNNIKKQFSIRDLENLSGIKAHTIRIWEKRYDLLSPERTETNIRTYSLPSLQKLLNITLLYNNGYKISKIAKIPDVEIPELVRQIVSKKSVKNQAINALKIAMINFDRSLFMETYNGMLANTSFRVVFKDIFIPLLNELGLLWQTNTISPAHEHFISFLVKEQIIVNTEKLRHHYPQKSDRVFVLFLPTNEIHDLGLLYLRYEICLKGYKTVYLGDNVPLDNLKEVLNYFDNIHFVSYFTVEPTKNHISNYIKDFIATTQNHSSSKTKFWVLGYQTGHLNEDELPDSIKKFTSIDAFVSKL